MVNGRLVAGAILALLLGQAGRAIGDWPIFRGNALQTGVAPESLPHPLAVRWKFAAKDEIEATAAIEGETVYVGSLDEYLYALNLATGTEKWKYKAGPIKAPPSVHDGAVYVGNIDGIFHCVDAASGKPRWTYNTEAEVTSGANFVRDAVLFGCSDEMLHCLSKEGKELWKFQVPGGPVLGSPAIIGERTFASGCDSTLHILDTGNGKELSAVELGGQTAATVAVAGDQLYVGTMSNEVLDINWRKGVVAWKFVDSRGQPFFASAAVTDKLVLAGCRDKRVYALDRKSGAKVWDFATRGKVDSSPVVAGPRVYVGSNDGNLYVLDLDKGTELQQLKLGKAIVASPAVAKESLVIATKEGVVYCLGAK